jgi:CRP/FNR family transcriptional regulator, cyclic AMP receptor protein
MSFDKDTKLEKYKKDFILCKEGDQSDNLYFIKKGKILIFIKKGSEIIPIAYLHAGDFFGELSFFDNEPRSANAVCIENCELLLINKSMLNSFFPSWFQSIASSLSRNLRFYDSIIQKNGIKKKKNKSIEALKIDEQRYYLNLLNDL